MHFIQWLSKLKKADSRKYYDATKQLVRIKASSAEYKKEHNVMLSSDFEAAMKAVAKENKELAENLNGLFHPVEKPFFIKATDGEGTIIRSAVYMGNYSPYSTVILTSDDNLEKYKKNSHFGALSNVNAMCGEEALIEIRRVFKQYEEAKSY